jgi:hypothetical protein
MLFDCAVRWNGRLAIHVAHVLRFSGVKSKAMVLWVSVAYLWEDMCVHSAPCHTYCVAIGSHHVLFYHIEFARVFLFFCCCFLSYIRAHVTCLDGIAGGRVFSVSSSCGTTDVVSVLVRGVFRFQDLAMCRPGEILMLLSRTHARQMAYCGMFLIGNR